MRIHEIALYLSSEYDHQRVFDRSVPLLSYPLNAGVILFGILQVSPQ